MTFWETFNGLCESIGEKPNPVAKKLEIASATVTAWKNGSVPGGDKLIKLAKYFNVSTDYLLGLEPQKAFIDLTENEQRILDIFKRLTESQQGQIIGRAELMAEYSMPVSAQHKQYTTHIAAFGGGNVETTATDEQLARAIKATEELKKSKK